MERIDKILKHDLFVENLKNNETAEADRRFCRHDIVHFLDVARIGMLINCEEERNFPKEWIYAVGLLHDIGKHRQYEAGIPHEIASAEIAKIILKDCDFDEKETGVIIEAILQHRNKECIAEEHLGGILYRADKASRACFQCEAKQDCNWSDEKKNLSLKY